MSPVFRRESEYTFKIYSNEEERMHIHVLCGGKEVKFWLEPQVELAKNSGIPEYKLSEIKKIVEKLQTTSKNNSANTSGTHFNCLPSANAFPSVSPNLI